MPTGLAPDPAAAGPCDVVVVVEPVAKICEASGRSGSSDTLLLPPNTW